mgnify:CR=1 FL=1
MGGCHAGEKDLNLCAVTADPLDPTDRHKQWWHKVLSSPIGTPGGIRGPDELPPRRVASARAVAARFRRRRKTEAERPTPSRANDDGSGSRHRVSENCSVKPERPRSTVPVIVGYRMPSSSPKVVLTVWDDEADRGLPFESISETCNDNPVGTLTTANDASVIGSLDGAVMVKVNEAPSALMGVKDLEAKPDCW